jgi:hypothetical protein
MQSKRFGLLGVNGDAKTIKGNSKGYATAILYLAPAQEASSKTLCPYASEGCKASCLYTAGRGAMSNVAAARIKKTLAFLSDREAFLSGLARNIASFRVWAIRQGLKPCVRLNGTSDVMWERLPVDYAGKRFDNLMSIWPTLQFYDYTKIPARHRKNRPANYDLTFSRSEDNEREAIKALAAGMRVAAVWREALPARYKGRQVIDADKTDLRFLEPSGVWSGLLAKGQAKVDLSGFVMD